MGIKHEFGKKIRRMRINRGLTQEQLSELANISQRALSRIETGENFVSAETIDNLTKALNTTLEELFSISHLKSKEELFDEILLKLNNLKHQSYKLELIYNFLTSIDKE